MTSLQNKNNNKYLEQAACCDKVRKCHDNDGREEEKDVCVLMRVIYTT